VYRHLSKQAKRMGVSCYRIYEHDLPEFPFCVEIYNDKIYVAEYKRRHGMADDMHGTWIKLCMETIADVFLVGKENIFLKLRQRKQGRLGQYQKVDDRQYEFVVQENQLKFIVNLSDYLDTGLFLDHRITRQMVRQEAKGKKVLNLFAYTGSFSVYAAAGLANEVVTVDLSKTYLEWATRNMQLNNFVDASAFKFIHADVKQFLKNVRPGSFDLIIMDPPTFSNSQRMEDTLDIQRDHVELINQCMVALTTEGRLYFSTNFSRFVLQEEKLNAASIKNITKQTTPFDFENKLSRYCYLITR
jgi:23S rRNA (cytosine1962-C5)-methyltransferase